MIFWTFVCTGLDSIVSLVYIGHYVNTDVHSAKPLEEQRARATGVITGVTENQLEICLP